MLAGLGVHGTMPVLDVVLPIGISFYTFEAVSYSVDVYARRVQAERNVIHFLLFITFFPRMVAGPIIRARNFLPQLKRTKRFDWARIELGVQYVVLGLFKKVAIADRMACLVDPVYASPEKYSTSAVWVAVLAYSLQIYCDFSGYSDIAIGTAHMLGFKLPENFNMPYLARNIGDFWRRWHISLSTWLRDYVFIQLGGSRGTLLKTAFTIMMTFALCGLWHGARWTFVAWGAIQGGLSVAHRLVTGVLQKQTARDRVDGGQPGRGAAGAVDFHGGDMQLGGVPLADFRAGGDDFPPHVFPTAWSDGALPRGAGEPGMGGGDDGGRARCGGGRAVEENRAPDSPGPAGAWLCLADGGGIFHDYGEADDFHLFSILGSAEEDHKNRQAHEIPTEEAVASCVGRPFRAAAVCLLAGDDEPGDPRFLGPAIPPPRRSCCAECIKTSIPAGSCVMMLGSSRVDDGVKPGAATDWMARKDSPVLFNFGLSGSDMFRELMTLRRLVADGLKPQRVGIEVLPVLLGTKTSIFIGDEQLVPRARGYELGDYYSFTADPGFVRRKWYESRLNPGYKWGMMAERQTLPISLLLPVPGMPRIDNAGGFDQWGWHCVGDSVTPAKHKEWLEAMEQSFLPQLRDFAVSDESNRAMAEILDLCKAQKIDAFLIWMPESSEFQAMYPPQANRAVRDFLEEYKTKYGVKVIDARSWISDDKFLDGHHMLSGGAAEFTRRRTGEIGGDTGR